jgi:hypothetical protein
MHCSLTTRCPLLLPLPSAAPSHGSTSPRCCPSLASPERRPPWARVQLDLAFSPRGEAAAAPRPGRMPAPRRARVGPWGFPARPPCCDAPLRDLNQPPPRAPRRPQRRAALCARAAAPVGALLFQGPRQPPPPRPHAPNPPSLRPCCTDARAPDSSCPRYCSYSNAAAGAPRPPTRALTQPPWHWHCPSCAARARRPAWRWRRRAHARAPLTKTTPL